MILFYLMGRASRKSCLSFSTLTIMQETNHHRSVFALFQNLLYFFILLDIYVQFFSFQVSNPLLWRLNEMLYRWPVLTNALYSHITAFVIILLVSLATRARKDVDYKAATQFFIPFILGILLFLGSLLLVRMRMDTPNLKAILYGASYLVGSVLLHVALSNVSKKIFSTLGKDRWNVEGESFLQNTRLEESPHTFNLPTRFYYKHRVREGWMNINPFRGIMVIGTPGSGKTESVIIPFIKQFLAKGFSMLVYDYKYPDLSLIAYHHYLKGKKAGALKSHHFHVLNLDRLEYSRRVNPLHPRYITTLADATETAETLIHALLKSDKSSGSAQFFTQSAINFVAACIYYFATYRKGKYSTLPHVLAFINQPYENIFNTLFDNPELHALLAPFRSAFDNRAFDQLEGQVGTVRVNISRIATKEAFWVFSAEDFDLKISNPASVLVMANSPQTQNINSAFYSVVVNRITKLVNSKGNNPTALVIDETPTIYLHKVENLIATARSNKVAVVLGLQELPQFHQQYGKDIAHSITSIMGTILSGSVRNKETLDWLEKLFGKVKQTATGVSVSHEKANVNLNERMDSLIPAAKIASLNAGELVGLVSRESTGEYDGSFTPNVFNCKIALDMTAIEGEKKAYRELPEIYNFGDSEQKSAFLLDHMQRIYTEVESILL